MADAVDAGGHRKARHLRHRIRRDQVGDVVVVETDSRDDPPPTLKGVARELIRGAYQLPNRLLLDLDLDRALALDASPCHVTRSVSEGERFA